MSKTKIEWCDLTINPIVGCSKCSPGCDNCYAEKMAIRLAGHSGKTGERYQNVTHFFPEAGKGWNGSVDVDFSCFWDLPRKPARIFVGSMGDVFHPRVSQDAINTLFFQLAGCPQHTFMLLTKRPRNASVMLSHVPHKGAPWPVKNVWLGVTVCNQAEVDEKIPRLLSTPAAKRFVSVEPMLEPVDLSSWMLCSLPDCEQCDKDCGAHEEFGSSGLDWVICGGETGPGARPMNPDWARSLRNQCNAVDVPFFFKQMSGKTLIPDDLMVREIPA